VCAPHQKEISNMATWAKEEIELQGGAKALAQMPVCYCYANINNAVAMENWKRHCAYPHADTIAGC
jgi:hypothetical protein